MIIINCTIASEKHTPRIRDFMITNAEKIRKSIHNLLHNHHDKHSMLRTTVMPSRDCRMSSNIPQLCVEITDDITGAMTWCDQIMDDILRCEGAQDIHILVVRINSISDWRRHRPQ